MSFLAGKLGKLGKFIWLVYKNFKKSLNLAGNSGKPGKLFTGTKKSGNFPAVDRTHYFEKKGRMKEKF